MVNTSLNPSTRPKRSPPAAAKLAQPLRLEGAGVRIWRDQDQILGGENYGPKIVNGIRTAKVLLLACSDASMRSKNVKQEIQLAWTYDIPYLPLLLERTAFPEQVEYWLSGSQWIEVLDRPTETW